MSELTLDPVFPLPPGHLGAGDITFLSADWFICQLGAIGGVGPTLEHTKSSIKVVMIIFLKFRECFRTGSLRRVFLTQAVFPPLGRFFFFKDKARFWGMRGKLPFCTFSFLMI